MTALNKILKETAHPEWMDRIRYMKEHPTTT